MESSTTRFRLNDWQVDPGLDTIANAQTSIKLDPRPMQVLVFLARHAGQVLNQRQIEQAVWGDVLVTTNSVYQCITQLRKALGDDAKQPQYIQTIPRKGYRLIATLEWLDLGSVVTEPAPILETSSAPTADEAATVTPIEAKAPVPRIRWRTIGITVGVLLLIGIIIEGLSIYGEQEQARREKERAEQVSRFMLDIFVAADPFNNLGRPITARELLEQAGQRLDADFSRDPLLRAQLLETLGRSYRRQGLHEQAVPALEEALKIRRDINGATPETGSLQAELGVAFHSLGRFADSDRAFKEALQIRDANARRATRQYARLVADIGTLELARSHPHQAAQLFNEGLQLMRKSKGPDRAQMAAVLEGLGNAYLWLDELPQSEQAARAAYDIHREMLPELHPDRVMTTYGLGEVLRLQGRSVEAKPLLQTALTAQQRLYNSRGTQVANTLDSLSLLEFSQNDVRTADRLAQEAVTAIQPEGATERDNGQVQTDLARQLLSRNDFPAAEKVAQAALVTYRARLPPDPQYIAANENSLGEALLGQQRFAEAEQVLSASAERWKQLDAQGWRSARCLSALGEAIYHQGRAAEAEPLLLEGYRIVAVDLTADQQTKRKIYQRLARFYRQTGRPNELAQLETRGGQSQVRPLGTKPSKE